MTSAALSSAVPPLKKKLTRVVKSEMFKVPSQLVSPWAQTAILILPEVKTGEYSPNKYETEVVFALKVRVSKTTTPPLEFTSTLKYRLRILPLPG